jgi:hypothetical protein
MERSDRQGVSRHETGTALHFGLARLDCRDFSTNRQKAKPPGGGLA